jgi:hypothetical protein
MVHLLISIFLVLITLGFIQKKQWGRKLAILYLLWSLLWTIWGLIIGHNVILHSFLFVFFSSCIVVLYLDYIKDYFKITKVFRYGEYTLYKRDVCLKGGKLVLIHFFSKHEPKSGTPTVMPDGYEIGINDRSKMPYLKKIGKQKPYKVGAYTLYKKDVKLKNGNIVTIHFFSRKKPKSGKPTIKPEGYEVKFNSRSNLPLLKKKEVDEGRKEYAKSKTMNKRKPSNVIYVVNKPQPGQVRGDWAVRSHRKIISHHRKKENAIQKAKRVAKKTNATVLIQKTDGTFNRGLKPKKT